MRLRPQRQQKPNAESPYRNPLDRVAKSVATTGDLTPDQEAAWLRECRAVEQSSRREARLIWQGMVDHILSEPPTPAQRPVHGDTEACE